MPTFGPHPTDTRLHLSGVGGLYTLASDHSRTLRVFQPTDGIWSDDRLRQEIDAFLLRYKTQRALAKDSKHWAPVHEISALKGTVEDDKPYPRAYRASGAYAVTDKHERSLATLFDSHVYVTNDDLRNLFTAIITGLLDAKRIAKRPHGALKLSNVLLNHSEPLASATVHLADPLPDGFLPAKPFDKDLHDLGKLIYALVLHRPFEGGTVAPSKEWKALGPNGEDWHKLAAALLDAGESSTPEDRDLEKLLPRIATWTLQPKKAPVVPIAIAAGLLVIGSSVGLYFLLRARRADYSQPNWARLCLAYDSWFGDFVDNATDPAVEKKFVADPATYPKAAIDLLNKAAADLPTFKPTALAKSGHSLTDLAVHPTDDAKSGTNAYKTLKALELIDAVQAALAPGKDPASSWPLLTSLDQTAAAFKGNDWNEPANAIHDIIAGAKPPSFTTLPLENADPPKVDHVDELARITDTVKAAQAVKDINKRWDTIQATLKTLPQTHVPLLENLEGFAKKSASSPDQPGRLEDITGLAASFARIETLLTSLSAELNKKDQTIVYDELAKDPAAQLPPGGVDAITLDNYTALPALAQQYVKLPVDPTAKTPYTQQLDKVQTEIIAVIQSANKDDTKLPKILQDHTALKDQVLHLASIAKISKNKDLLDSEVKKADDQLASLLREGDEAVTPYTVKPTDFLAQQQAYEATSPLAAATPVVRDQWKQHHQEYLAGIRTASQGMDHFKYADYVHYKENLAKLEADYLAFDALIPARVPGLADITAGAAPDWQKTIAARVASDDRSTALLDVMTKNLQWTDGLPQLTDPAYASFQKNRLAEFESLRAAALDLLTDYTTIQARLDHLDLQPNEPAPGDKSWHDLSTKWTSANSPLLADNVITAALKPITDRVSALLDLGKAADYAGVAAAATAAPAPELALTAWRKLGTLPISESNPLLDDELKAQTHLKTLLAADQNVPAPRAAAITTELATALPARWNAWSDTLSSPEAIQHALDLSTNFNVSIKPDSNPRMAFNQKLYDLKKAAETKPAPADADLKKIAATFLASARALPAANDTLIKVDLDRIDKTLNQSTEEESKVGAGPQLAGWTFQKIRDGVMLYHSPANFVPPLDVEFDRVHVGDKYIWIGATEVPVGLFTTVLNNAGVVPSLDNAKQPDANRHWLKEPAKSSDDLWSDYGPRGWKIVNGQMSLNDKWLGSVLGKMGIPGTTDQEYPYYDAKSGAIPVPSANAPVQNISPYVAIYFAHLMGCRLPTPSEWQSAFATYEAANTTKDAWNLRGTATGRQSFMAQQNYVATMHAEHALPFPDANVFSGEFSFTGIDSENAKPWTNAALAKLFPSRISSTSGTYNGSVLWFRDVGHEPGFSPSVPSGAIHDLLGNVAEFVFDPPNANAVVKDNKTSIADVDAQVAAAPAKIFVIGGSALSPPELDPTKPSQVALDSQAFTGFADVGFRLAYTAPIPSISEVLADVTGTPKYLKGPKALASNTPAR